MKWFVAVCSIMLLYTSCKKDEKLCGCVPPMNYLRATVVATGDLSCGKPLLKFEDTVALRNITGVAGDHYVARELAAGLNVQNKKLLVVVNKLAPEEDFFCTAIGTSYPHLKLVDARAE